MYCTKNKHNRSMGKLSHYRQLTTLGVSKKGDMKQVPYWGPTKVRRHRTKFSCPGGLATRF